MKKRILTGLLLLSGSLTAQQGYNHWSVDVAAGAFKAPNPYAIQYSTHTAVFPALELGGRYMFNNYAGVRLEAAYHGISGDQQMTNGATGSFKTNYLRLSVDGVMNLGRIMDFQSFSKRLGMLGYAGVGMASLFNDSLKLGKEKGSDEMISFSAGLSPQVRLSDRIALSLNLRATAHMYQTRTYDLREQQYNRGLDGFMLSGTLGFHFYLGKSKTHVDWYDEENGMLAAIRMREGTYDSISRAMQDGDHDGVPNYLDEEPETAEGAKVNVKGVTQPPKNEVTELPVEFETIDGYVELPEKPELFFTVQVGNYREPVDLEKIYQLSPLMKARTKAGETRYLYGSFDNLNEASRVRDVAFNKGVSDAFVAAYYQGKRITLRQAERLLFDHGKIITEAKR